MTPTRRSGAHLPNASSLRYATSTAAQPRHRRHNYYLRSDHVPKTPVIGGNMSSFLESARGKVKSTASRTAFAAKKISSVFGPLLSSASVSTSSVRRPAPHSFIASVFLLFFTVNAPALAGDLPNTPPDGWWWYYGQTPAQVTSLLNTNNARLVSIQVEQTSPLQFTVAMVQNTGALRSNGGGGTARPRLTLRITPRS